MAGERVLIVEDAPGVRKLLCSTLAREGFRCSFAGSGEEGLASIWQEPPDLIVLDLMLPAMDGLEVCRQIKEARTTRSIPVVMLTGLGEESDVIRGLEMGADDYIVKPFSPKVLAARLRTVLRRRADVPADKPARLLNFHALTIDAESGEVRQGGQAVPLTVPETRFLALLLSTVPGHAETDGGAENPEIEENPARRIEREGMTLFTLDRLEQVARLLGALPHAVLAEHPWLGFFAGLGQLHHGPRDSRPLLRAACDGFARPGDECAELLAVAQLLFSELVFGDGTEDTNRLARRAETLSARRLAELSPCAELHVAQCLALATVLPYVDLDSGEDFAGLALALAEKHDLTGHSAVAHYCRGRQLIHRDDRDGLLRIVESGYSILQNTPCQPLDRAFLRLLQLETLILEGDFLNQRRLQSRLFSELEPPLWEKTVLARRLELMQGVAAVLAQDPQTAIAACRLPATEGADPAPLLRLAIRALAAVQTGRPDEAGAALERGLSTLRGHPALFERALSGLLLAVAGDLLERRAESLEVLAPAMSAARELGHGRLLIALRAQQVTLELATADDPVALLKGWLEELEQGGQRGLRLCPPATREKLLAAARGLDLEDQHGLQLLAGSLDRAVVEEGQILPRLELQTLGGFEVRMEGRPVVRAEDMTPAQRELLGVLVAAPGMKLSQEEIQLAFWPDSSPDKARSNFDSLLLRLRKQLEQALAPHPVRHYLFLQKGILSLTHLRVDAHEFAHLVRQGLEHSRRREAWQAANYFARALALWKGSFMPGSSAREQAADYRQELDRLFVDAMHTWAQPLIDSGRTEEAAELLDQALRVDRTNDSLVRALCRTYLRSNQPTKARQAARRYAEALQKEDYSPAEIQTILSTFPHLVQDIADLS